MRTVKGHFIALSLAAAAMILVMIYHGLTLSSIPLWFVDESLTASRVQGILETGRANGPMDRYDIDGSGLSEIYVPNFPYYLFAVPVQYFGQNLAVASLRLTSLAAIAILLVGVGLISWRYLGPYAASLGILFSGFSLALHFGHVARPDIIAAGLGYLALGVYQPRRKTLFTAAFLAVLACAAHLRAVILVVPFFAVIFWDLWKKQLSPKDLLFAVIGLCVGGGTFYVVNVLPYSAYGSFQSSHLAAAQYSAPAALTLDWNFWSATIKQMYVSLFRLYPHFGLFILLGAVLMSVTARTHVEQRLWIIIWVTLVAGLVLILGMLPMKLLMVTPCVDLAATAIFCRIFRSSNLWAAFPAWRLRFLCASVAIYIIVNVHPVSPLTCEAEFLETKKWLGGIIAPRSIIMGQEGYWIYLQDHPFYSWKLLPYYSAVRRQSLQSAFEHFGADYFIFDDGVREFLADSPFADDPFLESMRTSRTEMLDYFAEHAEFIDRRRTNCQGDIEVFKFRAVASDS